MEKKIGFNVPDQRSVSPLGVGCLVTVRASDGSRWSSPITKLTSTKDGTVLHVHGMEFYASTGKERYRSFYEIGWMNKEQRIKEYLRLVRAYLSTHCDWLSSTEPLTDEHIFALGNALYESQSGQTPLDNQAIMDILVGKEIAIGKSQEGGVMHD